jgi:hypothetical protein
MRQATALRPWSTASSRLPPGQQVRLNRPEPLPNRIRRNGLPLMQDS